MNFEKGTEFLVIQEAKKRQKKLGSSKPNIVSVKFVLKLLDELRERSVYWSVRDFEERAKEYEEREAGLTFDNANERIPAEYIIYDRSKFNEAFLQMMRNHDATVGITWDTIDVYLDTFCRQVKSK